ncbi:hypothetical protein A6J40_06625 [Legionella longbeachae]|uniref:hypothetical protein n=1 Tax=Legionella longbeachae TaxID=450 RepID=UPI0009B73175|nr:hypothetical protein [Legionella longbeachae]ARB91872.1 hypothetical protein A6J40_06625 [Legionella longbeachae]RZV27027.1 hypothetical protein EKG34_04660 [Legionella longbeachae]UAK48239.1 hypothetical protein K8O86_08810 [Legionella longbeachae]VEE01804.1 Uncharacterised protein [Legionella oakridgensis]
MNQNNQDKIYFSCEEFYNSCLKALKKAYTRGGLKDLRGMNKTKDNRPFNDDLKKTKEELFPLALFLKKTPQISSISKILLPIDNSNSGFDAQICLDDGDEIFIEVTSTLDGKARIEHFQYLEAMKDETRTSFDKNTEELSCKIEIDYEKEINRIKEVILKKANKKQYEQYKPVLLVNFDNNMSMNFLYEYEFNRLKKDISEFILVQKSLLEKFSKIILIKFTHHPSFLKKFYNEEIVTAPNENEEEVFIWCAYPPIQQQA